MRKISYYFILAILLSVLFFVLSCSNPEDDINWAIIEPLHEVIERDIVIFENKTIPRAVLDSISNYRAIAFGEMHTILEEREMIAHLSVQLQSIGATNSICAECPQAMDWVYVKLTDLQLDSIPSWAQYSKLLPIVDSLREYNSTHRDKIYLHCIDANLNESKFVSSLRGYADFLQDNVPFKDYCQAFPESGSHNYSSKLNELQDLLENDPASLGFAEGDESIKIVFRMADNELLSIPIRENWNTNYATSSRLREDLIKGNADYYLSESDRTLLFYFGAYHVQKGQFLGSPVEWLGEYLHYINEYSAGKTISIVGIPMKGEIINGDNTGTLNFDLPVHSKPDDLLRIIGEISSSHYGWLAMTDSIFSDNSIRARYIYKESELVVPPKEQFDAYFILPHGTFAGW
jgi:hypothetical protein